MQILSNIKTEITNIFRVRENVKKIVPKHPVLKVRKSMWIFQKYDLAKWGEVQVHFYQKTYGISPYDYSS
jgi:hypothetical protein